MREARTLCQRVTVMGRGMHSGAPVTVDLVPAPHPTGIRLRRPASRHWILARTAWVRPGARTLALGGGSTPARGLEHLLAACHGLGICCLSILVQGDDAPGLDGSARGWLEAMDRAGLTACGGSPEPRRGRAFTLRHGRSRIRYDPAPAAGDVLEIAYRVDFREHGGDREEFEAALDEAAFRHELAPARTFAVRGVDRRPLPGVDGRAFWTNTPVSERRFPNELARHKALDLLGDLALVGWPIAGRVEAECAGHRLHQALAGALAEAG